MCIFTRFQYLCLHDKLKITRPCNKVVKDSHGVLTCPDTPNVGAIDNTYRIYADRSYGVGICSNIRCAWDHAILPIGDYGNNSRFGKSTSFEDDTEIDDSPAAREERVGRWFRLLSADQQLDHFKTEYPLPDQERSPAGRTLLEFPLDADALLVDWNTVRWQELNPLHLTPAMLQWCVFYRLLPASVADGRKSKTISPHKAIVGPFKPKSAHKCPKKHGICKTCGENIGNKALKENTLSYRQQVAMSALLHEDLVSEVSGNTVFAPDIDLKWDDEKGEYRKVPTNVHVSINDAPYPASSIPSFVPSMTQGVDTAAVFGGQDVLLADSSTHANMAFDFTAGMDWEAFVQGESRGNHSATFCSTPDWANPDLTFTSAGDLPAMPQAELDLNDFSFNAGVSFNTNLDIAANIDTGKQAYFDFGTPEAHFDPSGPNDEPYSFLSNTNDYDEIFSGIDPAVQVPHTVSPDLVDDPMITCDSSGDSLWSDHPADDFSVARERVDQVADDYSPETLNLAHQMLRQAFNGGVARPSYDPAANALFEQVLQYKRAELV